MAPLLLHIGFPKCGSTYLQQWFEKHPDVYFQPKHIAQGFYNAWEFARYAEQNKSTPKSYVLSCEDLTLFKSERDPIGYRISFESPHLLFQENICQMLYHVFPAAKVLIITRGYKTIFRSVYSQYISMGGALPPKAFATSNQNLLCNMLNYNNVISRYREKFGAANVIVLPYELMRNDLETFLTLIETALAIEKPFRLSSNKVNASYSYREITAFQKTSEAICKLIDPLPYSIKRYWYERYSNRLRSGKTPKLIAAVSKLLNTDLDFNGLEILPEQMKGKASILQTEPLHQPYLKEYLL